MLSLLVVSSILSSVGYELSKVKLKGRPASHVWKLDVPSPDEPYFWLFSFPHSELYLLIFWNFW
jgi:hypothetical protein